MNSKKLIPYRYSTTFYRRLKQASSKNILNSKIILRTNRNIEESSRSYSTSNLPPSCSERDTSCTNDEPYSYNGCYEENSGDYDFVDDCHDDDLSGTDDEWVVESFTDRLKQWALYHQITHIALTDLLKILKTSKNLDSLPICSKTLLRTPANIDIIRMGAGSYWYNPLQNSLKEIFCKLSKQTTISLTFNIDGLPISKSSKFQFWPILTRIGGFPQVDPIVIAIFYGDTKPPLDDYLEPFVNELNNLVKYGIIINDYSLNIQIRCFNCDTPARCYIKGTVSHNAYHSCMKCTEAGEYDKKGRHISFPQLTAPLRTNAKFRSKLDSDHHKLTSPIEKLPIDMVEDFPVADSLHLLDLGVMKRCLLGWTHGSFNFRTKWSSYQITTISKLLEDANIHKPVEIHRKIRSLQTLHFWKATEFRTFLLYLGPVILKDYLTQDIYEHFLLLFCATRICSCEFYLKWKNLAATLYKTYIEIFILKYGRDSISSNIHSLLHIIDDVTKFGCLPTISAYPFENKLYKIKRLIRTGNLPLSQAAKRIKELQYINYGKDSKEKMCYPYVKNVCFESQQSFNGFSQKTYRSIYLSSSVMLSNDKKNGWFLTEKDDIVEMINATLLEDKFYIHGKTIKSKYSFFEKPFCSSRLHIYTVFNMVMNEPSVFAVKDIKCKLFLLKYKSQFVFMPLLHTFDEQFI